MMTVAQLVPFVIQLSVALTVFAFALGITREDTGYLVRHPRRFAMSFLSMNVLVPLLAILFAVAFDLSAATRIALISLAVSPVSPLLPRTEVKGGGDRSYAIGLFAASALLSVALIPISIELVGRLFGIEAVTSMSAILRLVMVTVLGPTVAGAAVRAMSPRVADRLTRPIGIAGAVTLVAVLVPLLVTRWGAFGTVVGGGTMVALLGFCLLALFAGHLLGGNRREERLVLALSSATRHPGVAILVAASAVTQAPEADAAMLLYVLLSTLVGYLYVRWMRSRAITTAAGRLPGESPAAG